MTKEDAINHSIDKWEWIVKNWDYAIISGLNQQKLIKALPHLSKYKAACGLCEKYQNVNLANTCNKCPLDLIGQKCENTSSLFHIWETNARICKEKSHETAKGAAKMLLKTLKKIKEKR
jgi:hypothetical protein